jgi:hypothetical protein
VRYNSFSEYSITVTLFFPYGDKGALTGDDVFAPIPMFGMKRKQMIQDYLRELEYQQSCFDDI